MAANGTKEYKIVINGLQENINAVESLNKQLDDVEKRLNAINQKGVNVSTPKGGGSYKGELDAQEKLEKQILATEEKLAQVRDENYKKLLHMKEELKEYTQIAKSQVAAEANQQGLFDTNTMAGKKAQLKSVLSEMQMVEIGGDRFKELTQQANELRTQLFEIEKSYGQFGRNVGNYAEGVAQGMSKLKVDIGGVVQEFDNAKQALMQLKKEMGTLEWKKKQGIITQEEEERLKNLIPTVRQLESTIKDAGKPMDNLLDTMQSIMAIMSVGQGISAFFGMDDGAIERTIQKLVALQNIMQGLQVIQTQMNSGEGIGGWLAKGNAAIDKMVKSMLGLTTATKGATVATRLLGMALKSIGIGLVIAAIAALVNIVDDFIEKQKEAKEEAKKTQETINKSIAAYKMAKAELSAYADVVNNFQGTKKAEKQLVDELNDKYGKALGTYKTIAEWKDVLKKKTEAYCEAMMMEVQLAAAAQKLEEAYMKQMDAKNYEATLWEKLIEGSAAARKRVQAVADQDVKIAEEAFTDLVKKLQKHNQENKLFDFSDQIEKNNQKNKKAVVDGVKELYELQIAAMKEGLNKTIKQLEEERRQKLQKIKKDGVMVAELTKATNALYDKKIEDAKKEHAKEMEKIVSDMYTTMLNLQKNNADKSLQLDESYYEKEIDKLRKYQNEIYDLRNTSYGIQGAENLSPDTRKSLGLGYLNVSKEELEVLKEIAKLNEDIRNFKGDNSTLINMAIKVDKLTNDAANKYEDFYEKLRQFEHNYTSSINETFERRNEAFDSYWKKRKDIFLTSQNKITEDEKAAENARYELEKDSEEKRYQEANDKAKEKRDKAKDYAEATIKDEAEKVAALKKIDEEYEEDVKKIAAEGAITVELIEKQHKENLEKIDRDYYDKGKEFNAEYYAELMQNLRDFQTAIYNLEGKTEVKDSWGFINIKKTNENNKKLLKSYEKMADAVTKQKIQLNKNYSDGFIDKDVYESTVRELDTFVVDLGEKMDAVKAKMSFNAAFSALASEIDQWTQTIGRSLSQLLTSIWEYQDANYDHTMEELDKKIDEYDKLLQKQEDITREHADNINSIEDELSTARGDRRQHLIDQLNAEMQAQRESIAAEKRAQKEKKKAEDQQEQEELKQRKREHDRQVTQAFINWHLSISNALATQPFIPLGLAMGALATALGAVQYALVKNQKYADGGVLKGRSHAQGGIPVLGGRAEVEGNEFITNKRTTQQNTDLLYFINSKKRKLDLNDFIDFYGNGAVRKNIQSINRKYADGGVLPTLRTDIDVNSRLVTAMEDYSRRPVQVAVVDIIDKTQQVNNVKVMAGL